MPDTKAKNPVSQPDLSYLSTTASDTMEDFSNYNNRQHLLTKEGREVQNVKMLINKAKTLGRPLEIEDFGDAAVTGIYESSTHRNASGERVYSSQDRQSQTWQTSTMPGGGWAWYLDTDFIQEVFNRGIISKDAANHFLMNASGGQRYSAAPSESAGMDYYKKGRK